VIFDSRPDTWRFNAVFGGLGILTPVISSSKIGHFAPIYTRLRGFVGGIFGGLRAPRGFASFVYLCLRFFFFGYDYVLGSYSVVLCCCVFALRASLGVQAGTQVLALAFSQKFLFGVRLLLS
jgi:hypothetical protein